MGYMNQPARAVKGEVQAADLTRVAGVVPAAGDEIVELTHLIEGGNTQLSWHCGKEQFGERHDFEGTFKKLSGALIYNADKRALKAMQVNILLESFIGAGSENPAPAALTNTVISQGWFKTKEHPDAVFTAVAFTPEGAPDGYTHLIQGVFQLNGIEKQLDIPAKVTFSGSGVAIELAFTFDRTAFAVKPPVLDAAVDTEVKIRAKVDASPDPTAVMAQIASLLDEQQKLGAKQTQQITAIEGQLLRMNDALASLRRDVDRGLSAGPALEVSALPKKIRVTEPLTLKEFEFVLVAGNASQGIDPLYVATTEVTWDQFYTWSYSTDLEPAAWKDLLSQELRPSKPSHHDATHAMGYGQRPVIAISWLSATRFADWVGAQTGLVVRLPTESEWEHVFTTTQGPLDSTPDRPREIAWFDEFESAEVGSRMPNNHGIYDLLGGVFEWVSNSPDGQQAARGGGYQTVLDELKGSARAVWDETWNESYEQIPTSKWWYLDRIDVGFRLVLEPTAEVVKFAVD